MPLNARRELSVAATYDGSRLVQGIAPSKEAIRELGLELRGLKQTFATSGGDVDAYTAALGRVRDRAISYADGLDHVSDEYVRLTSLSAQATREIDRFGDVAGQGEQATSRWRSSLQSIRSSFDQFQQGLFFLTSNIQTFVNVGQAAFRALEDGAKKIELRDAFATQLQGSGQSVDDFVAKLDAAAGGTISDFDLMAAAARSMSLGVSGDADTVASLLEIARFKARQFGRDTTDAFNDIIFGLGRGSPLILDNIGIVLDLQAAYKQYADSLGVTVSSLTEVQKKQAEVNFVMQNGMAEIQAANGIVDSRADKLRILEVQLDKIKTKWLELLAIMATDAMNDDNPLAGVFDPVAAADAATQLYRIFQANSAAIGVLYEDTGAQISSALSRATQGDFGGLEQNFANLSAVVSLSTAGITGDVEGMYAALSNANPAALYAYEVALLGTGDAAYYSADAAYYAAQGTRALADESADLATIQNALLGETWATAHALEGAADTGAIAALQFDHTGNAAFAAAQKVQFLKDKLDQLNGARTGNFGQGFDFKPQVNTLAFREERDEEFMDRSGLDDNWLPTPQYIIDRANRLNDLYETINKVRWEYGEGWVSTEAKVTRAGVGSAGAISRAARESAAEQKRALKDLEREAQQAYDRMGGYVDKALSFQGGVQAFDDLLDRTGVGRMENRSNEIIRELEDVRDRALEGTRSPWLAQFMGLDNENLEVVAANAERRIRDLQAGIYDTLTEADKEAFKADALRLIGIQERADAYRDQLTRELLASGADKNQVDTAINTLLGEPSKSAATGTGADIGAALVDSLEAQVQADSARYVSIGELIGAGVKAGTLKGAEGMGRAIIDRLLFEVNEAVVAA